MWFHLGFFTNQVLAKINDYVEKKVTIRIIFDLAVIINDYLIFTITIITLFTFNYIVL